MTTASVHRVQIERIITRPPDGPVAEFKNGAWWCCDAWISSSGTPAIQSRSTTMTPEQASAVAIALQMALDWIAEEMADRRPARGGEGED